MRQGVGSKKESELFVVLLTRGNLALLLVKCVIIARKKITCECLAKENAGIWRKTVTELEGRDNV